VLWIRLPPGVASDRVFNSAKEAGVLVSPGTLFSYPGNDPGGIRISLTRTDVQEIRKGIERLGRIIENEKKRERDRKKHRPESTQHL
jgi:DNA-binding transcriptional MocR family regulator